MTRVLRPSEGITVSPALGASELAEKIWGALEEPALDKALGVLEEARLEAGLKRQVMVLLVRKSTDCMVAKTDASVFNASEVVRGVNGALDAQEAWGGFDWEDEKEVA